MAALIVATTSGPALAGPPTSPPGKSGDAPGQQRNDDAPGQAKKDDAADAPVATAPDVVAEAPVEAAVTTSAQEPAPVDSPRFENPTGKPKRNVPAAAEAAPDTSISAPGNSGRHKLTICHKGHAITVDVHAARAHVDGHGDVYAAAGAKGRAACPQPSPPPPDRETPEDPGRPAHDPADEDEAAGPATVRATPRAPAAAVAPGASPAPPTVVPSGGVSATVREERSAVASAVAGDVLPFTGAPLRTLVLFGLGLVASGLALVLAVRSPAPSTRR